MIARGAVAALLLLGLGGCVASLAYDAVTLPVRVVGAGINTVIPGQNERDRRRGKRERKAEERARKDAKKAAREARGQAQR